MSKEYDEGFADGVRAAVEGCAAFVATFPERGSFHSASRQSLEHIAQAMQLGNPDFMAVTSRDNPIADQIINERE